MIDHSVSILTITSGRCNQAELDAAVDRIIGTSLDDENPFADGRSVQLRVMVAADSNGHYRTVSHSIITAVGRGVQKRGGRILLLASPLLCDQPLRTIMEKSGLIDLARTEGYELVDFNSSYSNPVLVGRSEYRLGCHGNCSERIINLAFAYLDPFGHLNGILDSLVGFRAGYDKDRTLFNQSSGGSRSDILADLLSLHSPILNFLEAGCPIASIPTGDIFCSADALAIDSYIGTVLSDKRLLQLAEVSAAAGLGARYPESVALVNEAGSNRRDAISTNVRTDWRGLARKTIWKSLAPFASVFPIIDTDQCDGCRVCVTACQSSALTFDSGRMVPRLEESLCCECFACRDSCPRCTISVHKNRVAMFLDRSWRRNCAV